MSNPALHAFYVGRAFAEVLGERLEDTVTNSLSELGQLEAKQREAMREFMDEVITRAEQNENQSSSSSTTTQSTATTSSQTTTSSRRSPEDVQAMVDELRASIASLRTELNAYKSQNQS
jgi:polyhydroxyalkanoate synthesis regulator phasin